jgi:hypothetical protein
MVGLGLTPESEEVNRDASGYRRWLVSLAFSSFAVLVAIGTVIYGYGADTKQIQLNTESIKQIQQDLKGVATKDDVRDLRDRLIQLDERIQRIQEREISNRK